MAERLATAVLQLTTDPAGLKSGLTEAQRVTDTSAGAIERRLRNVGTAIAAAFSVGAIADMARNIADTASQIQDAADRIGISAEATQRLAFAAEQGGSSIEAVGRAIKTMADTLQKPSTGAKDAMVALGLSIEELRAMSPDQAFTTIADAIAKVPDPLKQSALATDLLGKSGVELLPAIKAGFTEIGNAAPVMSNATVKAADDMGDAWAETQKRIDVLKAEALTPLLDVFTQLPESMQSVIGVGAGLAPMLQNVGIAILGAGGPTAALGVLKTALTGIGSLLTLPAGAVVAAIVGLVAIWQNWDTIGPIVEGVYNTVKTFMVDKLVAVWTSIKNGLSAVAGFYKGLWLDVIPGIARQVYEGVRDWMVAKFQAIVDGIKSKIDAVTGFFRGMYETVVGHSIVPDMVDGVINEFVRMENGVLTVTESLTTKTIASFHDLSTVIGASLAPAIADAKASLDAYNLIAITSVNHAAALAHETREVEAEMRRLGLSLDFSAHTANNASVAMAQARMATSTWREDLQQLGQEFANLAQIAGGSLSSIVRGIGSAIQSVNVFSTSLASLRNGFSSLGNGFSGLLGGIASMTSGIGGLVSVAQLAWQGLSKLFSYGGPSAEEREGRSVAAAFREDLTAALTEIQRLEVAAAKAAGQNEVWATTVVRIRDAYIAAGRTEREALEAADRLWKAEKQGGDAVKRVIEEIERVMRLGLTPASEQFGDTFTDASVRARAELVLLGEEADAIKARIAQPITIPINVEWHGLDLSRASERAEAAGLSDAQKRDLIGDFLARNVGHEGQGDDRARIPSALGISAEEAQRLGFQHGTPGLDFIDFKGGTPVTLHGLEAVVPKGLEQAFAARHGVGEETFASMDNRLANIERQLRDLPFVLRNALKAARALA